jgi:very-short-patch-repair endonuclease
MTKHYNKKSEIEKRRVLRKEMTFCEKIMWIHLRRKQLGVRFLRQYSVDQFVIDFYSPEIKLAIELDGSVHDDPNQKAYDEERQKYLEKFYITFLRITNDDLMGNANMAFNKIEDMIRELKQQTPPRSSPLPKGEDEEPVPIYREGV